MDIQHKNIRKETAMDKDIQITLPFASISGKKVIADFDGGSLTSDAGVLFLREVERRIGLIKRLAGVLSDRRHQSYIDHTYEELLRQRIFQIACGYEDANDCNKLRRDPLIKAACERPPISGDDLASQPTMTRLENSISRTDNYRLARALVDDFLDSYDRPPEAIILDADDTDDTTHGDQQLTLFNAYYDEYCYQPLHVYEGRSGKVITTILRPGKRPDGQQIVSILKRLVAHIRNRWPQVKIFLRGDGHFSVPEVHDWCEGHHVEYVLGQTGNSVLNKQAAGLMEQARQLYQSTGEKVRLFTSFVYQAKSWRRPRRIICKVEIGVLGENLRFMVTSLESSQPSFLYQTIYCARGRMENYIKNHKTFLHSDRTSCHRFQANQFRLLLHSTAYVLLHTLAQEGLKGTQWVNVQFNTLQNRFLKVGARVCERVTRINLHFPTAFPLKDVFTTILVNLEAAFP
jgi:hypothetical protein